MVPDVHRFLLRSTQVLDLRRAAEVDMSAIRMLSKSPAVDAAVDQTRSEVEPDDPEADSESYSADGRDVPTDAPIDFDDHDRGSYAADGRDAPTDAPTDAPSRRTDRRVDRARNGHSGTEGRRWGGRAAGGTEGQRAWEGAGGMRGRQGRKGHSKTEGPRRRAAGRKGGRRERKCGAQRAWEPPGQGNPREYFRLLPPSKASKEIGCGAMARVFPRTVRMQGNHAALSTLRWLACVLVPSVC